MPEETVNSIEVHHEVDGPADFAVSNARTQACGGGRLRGVRDASMWPTVIEFLS